MKFTAATRATQGTSASRRLRREAKVPAILYGLNQPAAMIAIDHNEMFYALQKDSISTPLKMTCSLSSLQIFLSNADCFSASEMQMILSQNGAAIFSIAVYIAFFFAEHRILNAHPCGLYTQ